MRKHRLVQALVAAAALAGAPAAAQQRPLVTEDPETVGAGLVLVEGGFDIQRDILFPVSGLEGNLLRLPTVGVSLGVGSIAELQVDGAFYDRLTVTSRRTAPLSGALDFEGSRTTDVEDLAIGTKIRLVPEGRGHPAIGVRFATRLPIADNESGLGLDTLEVNVAALFGKTVQSIRVVGNAGLAIVGNPTRGDEQGKVVTYGVSFARAVRQGVEVVGDLSGRGGDNDTPGAESRGAIRLGGRFTSGTVRFDAGAIIGMTSRDPSFGFTAGFTWVFRAFSLP